MSKKQKSRRTGSSSQLSNVWMWIVGAVVLVAVLFFLARTLARTTAEPPPVPFLDSATEDLVSLTRMLGDIEPGVSVPYLPADVDSLVADRNWREAVSHLNRMLKTASPTESAGLRACIGFCYYQAGNLDRSLREFRKALGTTGPDNDKTGVLFSIAYLFQTRGFPDSAVKYYEGSRQTTRDSTALLVAILNNLGVAREKLADTASARTLYSAAALLADTAENSRSARTLRDNARRLAR